MTDTEKIELLFKAVQYIADLWRKIGFPVTFEREIMVDGIKVRITISAPPPQ